MGYHGTRITCYACVQKHLSKRNSETNCPFWVSLPRHHSHRSFCPSFSGGPPSHSPLAAAARLPPGLVLPRTCRARQACSPSSLQKRSVQHPARIEKWMGNIYSFFMFMAAHGCHGCTSSMASEPPSRSKSNRCSITSFVSCSDVVEISSVT